MRPPAQPLRTPSHVEQASHGGTLIQRVLKRNGIPDKPVAAVVELDDPELMSLRVAFIDATGGRPTLSRSGAAAFHVLWCIDESNAFVRVGQENDGIPAKWRISPGDTIYVPPCRPLAIGPGILGYEVSSRVASTHPRADLSPTRPTHGLERFEGYNRRTVCAAGPDLVLERWKVTQSLPLTVSAGQPLFVTNLVEPVAIVWHGGSDLIGRAESRLLPPGLGTCTFIPDGLGYLLVSYVPDPRADVVGPLREAGHDDAAIAALGALGPTLTQVARACAADDPRPAPRPGKASARSAPDVPGTPGTGT